MTRNNRIGGERVEERAWVKSIGKKLREDLGDCPTLPPEMLRLLNEIRQKEENELSPTRERTRPPR
jgi:hypothetical protein